jgi:hypothetical protein
MDLWRFMRWQTMSILKICPHSNVQIFRATSFFWNVSRPKLEGLALSLSCYRLVCCSDPNIMIYANEGGGNERYNLTSDHKEPSVTLVHAPFPNDGDCGTDPIPAALALG